MKLYSQTMEHKKFIDHVTISCTSGDGGAGSVHFRRARFIPKGGPDGGDGGKGGDIYAKGDRSLTTLHHLRYTSHIKATPGGDGMGKKCHGKRGEDQTILLPLGTRISDKEDPSFALVEVMEEGKRYLLIPGGRGGRGNVHFKSPTRRAPQYAQGGEKGSTRLLHFDLYLLADVALIGPPNAGKSTLLRALSAAKPRVAPYAFTTIHPQLGRLLGSPIVVADIPGLIEGASQGKGLGLRFLRHAERARLLAFVLPCDGDIASRYTLLMGEFAAYGIDLRERPHALFLSKCDVLRKEERKAVLDALSGVVYRSAFAPRFLSSHTKEGIGEVSSWLKAHFLVPPPHEVVNIP